MDVFGRLDSEGVELKMYVMDVFLWGRCLNEDEVVFFYVNLGLVDCNMVDYLEDNW